MNNPIRFNYTTFTNVQGISFSRPILPVTLGLDEAIVSVEALLDTGADINVLPYSIGIRLGADWTTQKPLAAVSGNLGQHEVRGIMLTMTLAGFNPTQLAFAWIQSDRSPIVFGQVNFFQEFNVCFFNKSGYFEIQPNP